MSSSIGAEFFNAEDEEELLLAEKEAPLSWRGDAATTHSDWTVIIETNEQEEESSSDEEEPQDNNNNSISVEYSVHKAILGVGPRSSTYFATLFQSTHFQESKDGGISHITLDAQDVQVFPVMLDYMYEGTLQEVSTENAVALRSLARYFHCTCLLKSVNEFIQQDLNITTAPTYLKNAYEKNDAKLTTSARLLILKHFDSLADAHALDMLPTPLFCSLWRQVTSDNHALMSRIVYSFFTTHPEARTATLLSELTFSITHFDVRVVSGFLELVAQLDPHSNDCDSWLSLDDLCKKCANTLVMDWRLFDTELCVKKFLSPSIKNDFRGTGRIAVQLLATGMNKAKSDYSQVLERNHQLQAANERLSLQISGKEERIASLEESNRHKDLEISGLQIGLSRSKTKAAVELQEHVSRLEQEQERVVELESQVKELQQELAGVTTMSMTKSNLKKRGGWSP